MQPFKFFLAMNAVLFLYKYIIQKYINILDEDINKIKHILFIWTKNLDLSFFFYLLYASLKPFLFQKLLAINV